MEKKYTYILIILSYFYLQGCSTVEQKKEVSVQSIPNVIITTDINNESFSMTDEHALIYLLWHLNNVRLQSVVLEEFNIYGQEKLESILKCYAEDFNNPSYTFQENNFPAPTSIHQLIVNGGDVGTKKIVRLARQSKETPLYILVMGSMKSVKDALFLAPDIVEKIRVISVGTGIKPPNEDVCGNLNWNGWGRTEIFERFTDLWWIENDWAFKGMSEGEEPTAFFNNVINYGALGKYLTKSKIQTINLEEAIPIMFLIDSNINVNHPEFGGWTGNYIKPFPVERPNYWVDRAKTKKWNYRKPCNSWELADQVLEERKMNIILRRENMFSSLLSKLNKLYSPAIRENS
ncbi:nucleoside hydrolase-like domain-containing protein [Flammeovirga sp. SJP92]|uniref:nucleoside hydrolase-like domain-containing protein n=1 Tax=Flammeovirga sp. SJP92 TaxID=1775430 RepID=UPI0012FC3765|nr:nucleoside hydrolase-like domain-containing protein [Flammeovirga sp. SJP92]